MDKKQPIFIHIHKDSIQFAFKTHYKKEENGWYSCYIPAYKIFFSAQDKETAKKRGVVLARAFFSHWTNKESFRSFILHIHKLGFKAASHHELTIKQLLTKQRGEAKFSAKGFEMPAEFKNSESMEHESHLAVA